MSPSLVAFITALQNDPALKRRFHAALAASDEADAARSVIGFAAAEGHSISEGDLDRLGVEIRRLADDQRVLDDDEVDAVTGGVLGALAATAIRAVVATLGPRKRDLPDAAYFDVRTTKFWIGM